MTGQELRSAREAAGLSPEQFAARLGVSGRTVYRYETGEIPIRGVREIAIHTVLGDLGVSEGKDRPKTATSRRPTVQRKAKRSK